MPAPDAHPTLHVTLSGDVYLKSRRTQQRMITTLRSNLDRALAGVSYEGPIRKIGSHRLELTPSDDQREAVAHAAASVFGIGRVDTLVEVGFPSLEGLSEAITAATCDRVHGRTFAVRVKRKGRHDWQSPDLARMAGALLVEAGGFVDLTNPQVEVNVIVLDDRAYLVDERLKGAAGLPLGSQDRVLCLLSGGFDSVVAAWMLMSRGCPVDFVHFSLNCAQSDHAVAVARELTGRWGHGMTPEVHMVEFQPVKDALLADVDSRMRQIALKVMMAQAAAAVASEHRIGALVTGDAMGQVSSQTLPHLIAVSNATSMPIFRPLIGLPKESIIDLARKVGTAELSARAQEVCDLSEGRSVATSASEAKVHASVEQIPQETMADAVATRKTFLLSDWNPGQL